MSQLIRKEDCPMAEVQLSSSIGTRHDGRCISYGVLEDVDLECSYMLH